MIISNKTSIMAKVKTMLVEAVLPAIKAVGKTEMEMVLTGIKQHHTPEVYQNTLRGLYSNFSILKVASLNTKTRIDDGLIDLVLEAVTESAGADGIVLL